MPARAIGLLSDVLLQHLADQALLWEACCRWPTVESLVHTVLIPKPTGGERPIALFRSAVRVLSKAKAWQANGWLSRNSPAYQNMAKGRRVGDAMWRTQMRGVIAGTSSHSAEFLVDLHKAFELVDRGLLLKAAFDAGYPCDVLAWGLSMYGWSRRLVFRQCVTAEMFPSRGIAAGSAFATTEL